MQKYRQIPICETSWFEKADRMQLQMNSVEEIKAVITGMSRDELSMFRRWFEEFDADAWDRQFEEDVLAGRLDALAEEALRDLEAGRCTEL